MSALIYIIQSLLTLALCVVLLRLLLQWSRADFRNPICQAIVRLTNPLIMPLRRMLPPVGKIDTASVVAVHPGRDRRGGDHHESCRRAARSALSCCARRSWRS